MNMENDTPMTPEQEIAELRATPTPTLRATAPGMEQPSTPFTLCSITALSG